MFLIPVSILRARSFPGSTWLRHGKFHDTTCCYDIHDDDGDDNDDGDDDGNDSMTMMMWDLFLSDSVVRESSTVAEFDTEMEDDLLKHGSRLESDNVVRKDGGVFRR